MAKGVLCFHGRVCIPNDSGLRQSILREAHGSPYAMHPSGNKLYRHLCEMYLWPGLKREVTDYVRPKLIADIEDKVKLIRDRLKEAFDRQKSYTNLKRKEIEYSVEDYVFLKRVGLVAYQLELLLELERIHDVFHVSMLWRYRSDLSHVVPVEEIQVRLDLTIEEQPVQMTLKY
ncbi:uncharacterized protein LOC108476363 [Gossypium arboreum]|uniref:uncharacterized protein LOC108476363 n=1 Tax=Gossypium arboreum TaxID=29729 RepID=UPI0008190A19|nr:uncharacterized protein LOC108476363 [Gossypium arboreum]